MIFTPVEVTEESPAEVLAQLHELQSILTATEHALLRVFHGTEQATIAVMFDTCRTSVVHLHADLGRLALRGVA